MLTRSDGDAGIAGENLVPLGVAALVLVLLPVALVVLLGLNALVGLTLAIGIVAAGFAVLRRWHGRLRFEDPVPTRRWLGSLLLGGVAVMMLIQAVPYGWDRSNPPVSAEPAWDSPRTRDLAVRACFDCHSNEVEYPWYTRIAPVSWAAQRHVSAGRDAVNFSEWDRPQEEADESAETVIEGSMPPRYYTYVHAKARLSDAERRELTDGLTATIGRHHDD